MTTRKTLVGVVGAATAALLYVVVPKFEGIVHRGYIDSAGIPTKCAGDTHDVVVGRRYSDDECKDSLESQLTAHAEPVLKITPGLRGHPYQLAAAISFAYNIGVANYAASTTARRFNEGDWRGACRAINESDNGTPQWVTSKGEVLPGLVRRRAEERALCERGIN
ncbi:lysozyme [Paraburkholderia azotifigens]|uniref:lysozyme n=1 Tax=Paraburkholderia azotifigens TaxID=2057004 RepID=UPI003181DA66